MPLGASSAYSVAGYYATHGATNNVSHGSLDHRKLRRSQSAITSSQLLSDDGSPPNSAIGQVVKVDISRSKSEYATVAQTYVTPKVPEIDSNSSEVMSSFRPSDSAKLYASPEQIKMVGYRNPELMAQLNRTKNDNGNSAKNRSQSLPPATNRPVVQRPTPEKDNSIDSGIYSSTHSTFKGGEMEKGTNQGDNDDFPLPPSEEDMILYAKPQNNKSVTNAVMSSSYTMGRVEPSYVLDNRRMSASFTGPSSAPISDMPEPDYSSEDDSTYDSQREDLSKVETIKRKKHTAIFAPGDMNNCTSSIREAPHYAAPIIKETPASTVSSKTASYSPPQIKSANFSDLIAKKAAERRVRQGNSENTSAPGSATSSPSRRVDVTAKGLSDAILESALFNKQKSKATNGDGESNIQISKPASISNSTIKMKNSKSCPNDFSNEDVDKNTLSSGIRSDTSKTQDSTYVTVINTESNVISKSLGNGITKSNSIEESSISSESSEDASDRTWILTNDRGDQGDSDGSISSTSKRGVGLTRNAVSLVKLPPPQEKTEMNLSEKSDGRYGSSQDLISRSERESHSLPPRQLPSSHPLAGSHPLPYHLRGAIHPSNTHVGQAKFSTLQRPHSNSRFSKASSDPPQNQNIRNIGGGTLVRSHSSSKEDSNFNSGSATLDRKFYQSTKGITVSSKRTDHEKSIDESLQLIRMHMNSLNEVNSLAGIPVSKHYKDNNLKVDSEKTEEVLAPPPQFSDPSAQYRNERISRINNDDYPIRISKRSNRRLEEEFISAESGDDRNFRNKSLDEWTTNDTTDWLESLYMPEYKNSFENKKIDGEKLIGLNNESLINLGVRRVSHRVNMEKSLKRYRPVERIDL